MASEAVMRRVFRFIFTFILAIPTLAATSFLIEVFNDKPAPALVFAAAGVIVLFVGKYLHKDHHFIFWFGAFSLFLALTTIALVGGFLGVKTFFSKMFFNFIKGFVCVTSFIFWYGISTLVFKLSRDEELRLTETPSETELRHAQERRDPALDAAEQERLDKMLAAMPESEREALLKKQKEWEDHQKKD